MTFSRRVALLTSAVMVLTVPRASAAAVGTVDLSWNACSPILSTVAAGTPGPVTMFLSVTGHDLPHKSYQARVILDSESAGALRDAWRFDAAGCQTSSRIEIRHRPPASVAKSCPAFMQGASDLQSLQIKDYFFDGTTGRAQCFMANAYPDVASVDPATRYFLMGVVFDHTNSVPGPGTPGLTCGGFEVDVFIDFESPCGGRPCGPPVYVPRWLDLQGVEHDFVLGNARLTFCGSCAVPAEKSTWGSIKDAYRR
jgi:hypothetical protein